MALAGTAACRASMLLMILFLVSMVAFLLSAITGGGAGLLLLPVIASIVPAAQAPAALSIGTSVSSVSRLMTLWSHVRWTVVRWFVPAALPAAALGAWMLTLVEPLYIQLLLGLFLSANVISLFSRRTEPVAPAPDGTRPHVLVLIGVSAGIISGFTGAVGLLFNRFYHRMGLKKEEIVATRAMNEVSLHLLKLGLYAWFGLLGEQAIFAGIAVASAAVLAAALTPRMLSRLSDRLFRRLGLGAMVLAGLSMTSSASSQILLRNGGAVALHTEPREVEVTTRWRHLEMSAELDGMEGLVVERRMDPARLSPALRHRIDVAVGSGRLLSVEKALRLTARTWEIEFERDGAIWEINLPRLDGER